ncbi:MFS transporter [Parapedobacter tibetensis]|uniref:MFS transporter n=1 Tax=Parapedobacter tibetensis TaxID=2972951 RepID=UPI00214D5EDC|nr:MFS transporter [Parapedobacter tibetensis]
MLQKLRSEITHFNQQPLNFRVLVLTNLIYAFVLPVIDIFVAAYVMRSSNDPVKVVVYQLTIYTGIPLTFLLNGYLLNRINIKTLYAIGMMLSAVSMMIMMSLKTLDIVGLAIAGLTMGMSFGFYWANRDYLALAITNNGNRNYYYGLETFFYTIIAVVVPVFIGWFIVFGGQGTGDVNTAYRIVTAMVFIITILASIMCFRGTFTNPTPGRFVYFKFHRLWKNMLVLAALKGLAQGFLVTAPAMLIMRLVGNEGALGTVQSIGAIVAAVIMYAVGRLTKPSHRLLIFSMGLICFTVAAVINGALYNATGVLLFMLFLLIAKPLLDLAYFPIQFSVIDFLSKKEKRNEFAYILNHELGLYAGRFIGAMTFIGLAWYYSEEIALRYAIIIIAVLQLCSIFVAKRLINTTEKLNQDFELDPQCSEEDRKLGNLKA